MNNKYYAVNFERDRKELPSYIGISGNYCNEDDAEVRVFASLSEARKFVDCHRDKDDMDVYVHDGKIAELLKAQESPDYVFGKGLFEFED